MADACSGSLNQRRNPINDKGIHASIALPARRPPDHFPFEAAQSRGPLPARSAQAGIVSIAMKSIPLISGQKYTVYTYTAARTNSRKEVVIQSTLESPEHHPCPFGTNNGTHRIGTYTMEDDDQPHCHLEIDLASTIILPGWDAPTLPATTEVPATPETIHKVLTNNINPHFERFELLATCPELPVTSTTDSRK